VDPYRPLHVFDDKGDDPRDHDEYVLAILLIVLGLARVLPAICLGEGFGTEATIASLMLFGGIAIALQVPHRFVGIRRRWGR
jgi:hypothetical protein